MHETSTYSPRTSPVPPLEGISPGAPAPIPFADLSLGALWSHLLRHRTLILSIAATAVLGTAVASVLVTPLYTSTATILPESRSGSLGALSPALLGAAAQFGVSLGGSSGPGPQFYAELLKSREIETRILLTKFARDSGTADSTLLELLKIKGTTPARRLDRGLEKLSDLIATDVDPRTSIVNVAVDAPGAPLAQAVARRLIDELNQFNLERKQSQAHARRLFIQGRLNEVQAALRQAEDDLQGFYDQNRTWESSARLRFDEQRYRRKVTMQDELLSTLQREFESARIDEVNDTPVLTVIDAPSLPVRKSWPKRVQWVILGLIAGMMVGVAIVLVLPLVAWRPNGKRRRPAWEAAVDR